MKIYVGGTYTDQARLRRMAEKLLELGHEVTGSWLQETSQPAQLTYDQWMLQLATKDIAELVRADCLIMDVDGTSTSGGRYTEWGVACHPSSTMLRYVVGGKKANNSELPYGCFVHLTHGYFDTWDDLLAHFKAQHCTNRA